MDVNCTLEWFDTCPTDIYTSGCGDMTLLQSPAYISAVAEKEDQRAKYCKISINGQNAGYAGFLEKKVLGKGLHIIKLDRGPVWDEGFGDISHFEAFLKAFRSSYPKRLGRRIRFIPEIPVNDDVEQTLKNHRFRKKSEPYQTLIVDLTQDPKDIRDRFRKNWRGSLNKAEREGLQMDWDDEGKYAHWLTKFYCFDKRTRGYKGPSQKFLNLLAKHCVPNKEYLIGRVMQDGLAIAAILVLLHGHKDRRAATYQIGWNTQKGRETGAHNFALWQAVLELQKRKTHTLDLGGVNDTEGEHVKKFKTGMGGTLLTLPGVYVG